MQIPEILGCGVFDSRSSMRGNVRSLTRRVKYYEIEYYPEDGKTSVIDGAEYPILVGNVVVAKPGQMRHSLLHMRNFYIWLSPDDGEVCKMLSSLPDCINVGVGREFYEKLFPELRLVRESNKPNAHILAAAKVCELVSCLYEDVQRNINDVPKTKKLADVMKALEYADKNFTQEVSLEILASEVNVSPVYLHKIFTSAMGKTPHQYVAEKRIERAKNLLTDPKLSLDSVAGMSGFGSVSYFCTAFKKICGVTPTEYRIGILERAVDN